MSFLHPSYLWAFLGLAIPIAIHLWSKKEAKTIKIGSVQLLSESKSKQSSSIQLNEWWLLVLRMLLISLVVLFMAKPQWSKTIKNSEITYLLEPGLASNAGLMQLLDSLSQEREVRLLERGFPIITNFEPREGTRKVPDYWQLASEMDAIPTDSIVVFTEGWQRGLKGMRPQTDKNIHWVVMDSDTILEKGLLAYEKTDGLELVSLIGTSNRTQFRKERLNLDKAKVSLNPAEDSLQLNSGETPYHIPVKKIEPLQVELFYADSLSSDRKYIQAAFEALSNYLGREIMVEGKSDASSSTMENPDLTVWLSEKPRPNSYQKLLLFQRDSLANDLITTGILENTYLVTDRLNLETSIDQRLTEQLLWLLDLDGEVKEKAVTYDVRKISETVLKTNLAKEKKQVQRAGVDSSLWLGLLLGIVMIAERFLAYKRKQ